MDKKSIKQREALRKKRNEELESVTALDPGFSCQGEVGKFIGIYIQSEVFAMKLQTYYRADTKKPKIDKLNISTLKAALNHFNINLPEADVSILFKGGPGKRGSKTARQLRNGYLHALSPEDKKEIIATYNKYTPMLEIFLSKKIKST